MVNSLFQGSSYWSIPIYRPTVNTVHTKLYQAYRHIVYGGIPMYRPYRSLVGLVHTARIEWYVMVLQIIVCSLVKPWAFGSWALICLWHTNTLDAPLAIAYITLVHVFDYFTAQTSTIYLSANLQLIICKFWSASNFFLPPCKEGQSYCSFC